MVLITVDKATYLAFFMIVLLALASIIGIITLIITFSIKLSKKKNRKSRGRL